METCTRENSFTTVAKAHAFRDALLTASRKTTNYGLTDVVADMELGADGLAVVRYTCGVKTGPYWSGYADAVEAVC